MSNMPLVPPILPLVEDEANKPEPGSEAEAREKAERIDRLEKGEGTVGDDPLGEPVADTVRREIVEAERLQQNERDS
jgi:hypothetical protein